jgi:hypothetical protein
MPLAWVFLAGMTAGVAAPSPGREAASSFGLDPSIRAAGMGRSSVAVFWGGDPNYWANPALGGYLQGVRFDYGRTQLIPDLADDVIFKTKRLALGLGGVGLAFGGKPGGLGSQKLAYGWSVATDEQGNEIGRFQSWEKVHSLSFGVNVAQAGDFVLEKVGYDATGLWRIIDFSWGRTWKEAEVFLAPREFVLDGERIDGSVSTHDEGLLIRATPYNSIDGAGLLGIPDRTFDGLGGLRLDASYGRADQSEGGGSLCFVDEDCLPIYAARRTGWAVRAACGLPPSLADGLASSRLPFPPSSFAPLVSLGGAWDRIEEPSSVRETRYSGAELVLANVLFLRYGKVKDPDGGIDGHTWGIGVGIPIGDFAGIRWDHAEIPQASGLDRVGRTGVSAFFDPLALRRYLGERARKTP